MLQQILKSIDQHDPTGFQDTVTVSKQPLHSVCRMGVRIMPRKPYSVFPSLKASQPEQGASQRLQTRRKKTRH